MVPPTCGYIFKEYSVGRVKNKKNGSSHPDEGDGCPEGAVGLPGGQGGHDGLVPEDGYDGDDEDADIDAVVDDGGDDDGLGLHHSPLHGHGKQGENRDAHGEAGSEGVEAVLIFYLF